MAGFDYKLFERGIEELDIRIARLREAAEEHRVHAEPDEEARANAEADRFELQRERLLAEFVTRAGSWEKTLIARHSQRPYTLDYVRMIFDDFVELHGDRCFADDGAMVGGVAKLDGVRCMILGQQKGRDLQERQKRNFGMSRPEGYRKAIRLMGLAQKFGLPLFTFVDTPAADPGVEAEERGISQSIAECMRTAFHLTVPTVAVITGEGGSGGAIAVAVANRICMLEHAIYSVIPPEGCAAILWRDPARNAEAAEALKLTATNALQFGLVDEIIAEPLGGAHRDPAATAASVKKALLAHHEELAKMSAEELRDRRHERFRQMGKFSEPAPV